MKIAVASDRFMIDVKTRIKMNLLLRGYTVIDVGAYNEQLPDSPYFAEQAAICLARGEAERAVVVYGSELGKCMAGQLRGARTVVARSVDAVRSARRTADANVLGVEGMDTGWETLSAMLEAFLATEYIKEPD